MSFFLLIAISIFFQGCDSQSTGVGSGKSLFLSGERPEAAFGSSGDIVGDLNKDGFADVVIGAPGDSRNGSLSGTAYVYFGHAEGLSNAPDALLTGRTGDEFGNSIAGIGDVNGDGKDDFAVTSLKGGFIGAPSQATVSVYYGDSFAAPNLVIIAGGSIALTVSSAGDLNQDGLLDLAVGDPASDTVYVFFNGIVFPNSSRLQLSQADLVLHGPSSSRFGAAIAAVGDINAQNQGKNPEDVAKLNYRFGDDFAVGAPKEGGKGAAYILLGRQGMVHGDVQVGTVAQRIVGAQTGDEFGYSIAGVGDFNSDGVGDAAVGAPGVEAGRVELYFGRASSGLSVQNPAVFTGEFQGDRFGAALSGMLPGFKEYFPLLVGAPFNNFTGTKSGSVYLFSKALFPEDSSLDGVSANASFADVKIRNPNGGAGGEPNMGMFVGAGLDVNGDGIGDVLTGAPGAHTAGTNAGGALILW